VWGAGLLFLSRHPIVEAQFHPHTVRADWEMLAAKGSIEARVRGLDGVEWTYWVEHLQEGVTARAERARCAQAWSSGERTRGVTGPLVRMADDNVPSGTREHHLIKRALRLNEVVTGDTYIEPNHFQDKLQAPRAANTQGQRIDYFYHGDAVMLHSAEVLWDRFSSRDGTIGQSDHARIRARFYHRPEAAAPARIPSRPRTVSLALEPAAAFAPA
jgi:hypothetical protein